jgi:hypothetical protein
MGNVFYYHLLTKPPLILILGLFIYGVVSTLVFVALSILFGLIYWPWVDFRRLKALGLLENESFTGSYLTIWKLRFQHYGDLMTRNA